MSLQSCPTLCDPTDSSPPGSAVPGILQARTLEWVAISFSNAWKWKVKVKSLSRVRLLATPWTAAYQAPPSMGFSRQEYWPILKERKSYSFPPSPQLTTDAASSAFMLPSWPFLCIYMITLWYGSITCLLINEIFKTSFPIPYITVKELSKEKCCIFVHQVLRKTRKKGFPTGRV